jgi:hypothetical protein
MVLVCVSSLSSTLALSHSPASLARVHRRESAAENVGFAKLQDKFSKRQFDIEHVSDLGYLQWSEVCCVVCAFALRLNLSLCVALLTVLDVRVFFVFCFASFSVCCVP